MSSEERERKEEQRTKARSKVGEIICIGYPSTHIMLSEERESKGEQRAKARSKAGDIICVG